MGTIRRTPRERNWTTLHNATIEDDSLSWEALGMLAFLLSKPDNWTVRTTHLIATRGAGKTKVRRILKEIEAAGYLVRKKIRDDSGRFDYESVLYDTPQTTKKAENGVSGDLSQGGFSGDGSSGAGASGAGKPGDIVKTDSTKTDLTKTERETRAREASSDKATPAVREAGPDSVTSKKEHTPESVRAWTLKQVKSFLPERDFSDHAEDIADTAAKAWQVGNGDVTPEAVASAAFGGGLSHSTTQLRSLKRFGETHGTLKLIAAATIGAKVHGRYAAGRLDGIARQWSKSAQSSSTRSIDNLVASGAIGAIGR